MMSAITVASFAAHNAVYLEPLTGMLKFGLFAWSFYKKRGPSQLYSHKGTIISNLFVIVMYFYIGTVMIFFPPFFFNCKIVI